jgi:pimeloyl-ACP methyl ester carboxylesterase
MNLRTTVLAGTIALAILTPTELAAQAPAPPAPPAWRNASLGTEGFASSDGVKIHYVTLGQGPLVVMIHGFPDYWFTWRNQMPALAESHQVVAIDQRGYNKSDHPAGVENYRMEKLVGDVKAVIRHFERDKAVVVGHD